MLVEAVRVLAEQGLRAGLLAADVAEVAGRAVTERRPRTRYLAGKDAAAQAWLGHLSPDRLMDAVVRRALLRG